MSTVVRTYTIVFIHRGSLFESDYESAQSPQYRPLAHTLLHGENKSEPASRMHHTIMLKLSDRDLQMVSVDLTSHTLRSAPRTSGPTRSLASCDISFCGTIGGGTGFDIVDLDVGIQRKEGCGSGCTSSRSELEGF